MDELVNKLIDGGIEKLRDEFPDESRYRHAKHGMFTDSEAKHLDDVVDLVKNYLNLNLKDTPRPLCIAIFGSPGSGKSRLVKQFPDELLGEQGKKLAPLAEINLTQVSSVDCLAEALYRARGDSDKKVPFIFFDEFDSKLDSAPWGWLRWFLAPMQDGAFLYKGKSEKLTPAVYVFAGGTACSFEDFGRSDPEAFGFAKGPDFISRLRGYLNIPGINADPEQDRRRAVVLHHFMNKHHVSIDDDKSLRAALINVGRYKYGARSMEALIELMPRKKDPVKFDDISDHKLLGMHVDRGPLDPNVIGGCIGLSGGVFEQDSHHVWKAVCELLLRDGAVLAAGSKHPWGGLPKELEQVIKPLPPRLEPDGKRLIVTVTPDESNIADKRIDVQPIPKVETEELLSKLPDEERSIWRDALKMFRMRYQLALLSVARFAFGGHFPIPKKLAYVGYPGVGEELMLALLMEHPVYIAGAYGGGAHWAGVLLGLGRSWTGRFPGFDHDRRPIPPELDSHFRPPPFVDLPLTRAELVEFFESRALGGPGWVNNGLSSEENRELFESKCPETIAKLVQSGLLACFSQRMT